MPYIIKSFFLIISLFTGISYAETGYANLTTTPLAIVSLGVFVLAYLLVMGEEFLHLKKSKPVILAAGIIWTCFAYTCSCHNRHDLIAHAIDENLVEYTKLLLFLLSAMTYVNAIEERGVFNALRAYLVRHGLGYRALFWITGILAFFISPIADNLTTALVMCAVVVAVGGKSSKFISLSCINIVVAANAGGAFSPFGDITTLMVWSAGKLPFAQFFHLFIPAVINFIVPAIFMHFAIPNEKPAKVTEKVKMKHGAKRVIFLFFLTILTAVAFHNYLHLPPALGMMTGLGYLQFFGYYLQMRDKALVDSNDAFDIFERVKDAEWDTLLFFYGITLCVGGIAHFGFLNDISHIMYNELGSSLTVMHQQTPANIIVGILSSIVDNIPVMYAVLTMDPAMSAGQWMLVTLTAGVGGSLLSIGSAAGVALMGQARGHYTFMSHLAWSWAIMLGYIASIFAHIYLNSAYF